MDESGRRMRKVWKVIYVGVRVALVAVEWISDWIEPGM